MKKKQKGFTLIELLAVIVILAIILLIAVPQVLDTINQVEVKAFEASVNMMVKAADLEVVNNRNAELSLAGLEYSGERYETGSITVDQDGRIELYIWNDKLETCAVKSFENDFTVLNDTLDETSCVGGASLAGDITPTNPTYNCYNFDNTTGTLISYDIANPACSTDLYVPTSIDGVNVTAIGTGANPYDIAQGLTSVDLSDASSVSVIRERAFVWIDEYSNSPLTSVILPDSIVTIGNSAFEDNSITSITLPEGLETIGDGAFSGNSLTEVTFPETLKTMNDSAFSLNQLTTLVIPASVENIGDYAFVANSITSVTFNSSSIVLGGNFIGGTYLASLYNISGAGTYTGTQYGSWTKN